MNRLLHKSMGCICAVAMLTSCSSFYQPIKSSKAKTDYRSGLSDLLRSLPPPKEPIIVSVYKFRDQTGQYKSSETLAQFSTAVSQGATAMLVRALFEAGNGKWFKVLEREGLTDLMNERKIIHQTREMYSVKNDQSASHANALPPLLYAPIILEGGVVAYETNLLTGGIGAHYFGLGGSSEFRRDTVTSMLRAVSVKNGQVLNHVDSRKTILSMALDAGLFRYVSFKRLLEAEAGITSNEPPQMAVMESIEACVYAMIMEGLINNIWSFAEGSKEAVWINEYLEERDSEMVAVVNDQGEVIGLKPKNEVSVNSTQMRNVSSANNEALQTSYIEKVAVQPAQEQNIEIKADSKSNYEAVNTQISLEEESLVLSKLQDWANAWSAGNANDYLSYYQPDFKPNYKTSYAKWKNKRLRLVQPSKGIKVNLADINTHLDTTKNVIVTKFKQNYQSKNYGDLIFKKIIWRKINGQWLISEEKRINESPSNVSVDKKILPLQTDS